MGVLDQEIDQPVSSYMHGELFICSRQFATMDACYILLNDYTFVFIAVFLDVVAAMDWFSAYMCIHALWLARSLEIVCDSCLYSLHHESEA